MSNLWPLALLSPFIFTACGDKEQDTAAEDTSVEESVEEEDTAEEPEDTASEEE